MITLKRIFSNSTYTIGRIFNDGRYICDTLEPTARMISDGIHGVIINWSPRFHRRLPLILNTPGRTGIRIHAGNTASDSQGCILVGWNTVKGMVTGSRKALNLLMDNVFGNHDARYTLNIETSYIHPTYIPQTM